MDLECRARIISDEYAALIVENDINLSAIITQEDYCLVPIDNSYSVLYIPINQLPPNLIHIYGYQIFPSCFGLVDIPSLESSGITRVRSVPGFSLRGDGILIGVIDTGIEYTHNAFRNADGSTRITSIWDQTIQEGTPPEDFLYGTEYSREIINQALQSEDPLSVVPSTDEDGHGTMVAGIAAGSVSEENDFSGVAPDVELVVVKLRPAREFIKNHYGIPLQKICYDETDILMALRYLNLIAANLNKPIAICFSLGTFQGSHDDRDILSAYVSTMADQLGIAMVVASGNEGNRGHHYYGEIPVGSEYNTVELNVGENEESFSMELWGFSPNTYSIDILSPSGEYIPRIPARLQESREVRFIFEETIINIDYQIIEERTGDPMIFIRFLRPAPGIWRFRVYSAPSTAQSFHIWLPIQDFLTSNTAFVTPNNNTTLTSPGNTTIPIVTTTYDDATGSLFLNAGRGYTRMNNISPAFAAPGVDLIVPSLNNTYSTATGSSLAAAHTTGVAAMFMEWALARGTLLTSLNIKNILIRGARRTPGVEYPNREWGYGILDVYGAFESFRGDINNT